MRQTYPKNHLKIPSTHIPQKLPNLLKIRPIFCIILPTNSHQMTQMPIYIIWNFRPSLFLNNILINLILAHILERNLLTQ